MVSATSCSFASRFMAALVEAWVWLFAWIPTPVGIFLRLWAWRFMFASCGSVRFATDTSIISPKNMSFGNNVRIGKGCFLSAGNGRLTLADNVALSPNVNLGGDDGEIVIGRFCAIGPGTVIRAANHRFSSEDLPICCQGHEHGKVTLEEDVWVGANCVILPNVRIGKGSIIGAGSVVTRDVAPGVIAAGVPAREIGKRGKNQRD